MRLNLTFCLILILLYNRPTLQQIILDDADIGFVGNFAGVSISKSPLQFERLFSNSSLIRYTNSSVYEHLSTFNGNITCSCTVQDDIYFGGYFNTLNDTIPANYIVKYNTRTNVFQPLLGGLDGPVYSLYCDTQNLFVGGNFSNHATQWSFNANNWTQLPWKGFNGPVYTIRKDPQRNTILFGGRFDATMDGQFFNSNTSQLVTLSAPTSISSGNGDLTANNDPSSIICPGATPWYLQAGVPGYWDANFANPIQPIVFRLSNTKQLDRGTISFNILSLGSNEYYGLAYVDPVTQQTIQCSTECILSYTTDYQDFTVIENKAATKGIRININSWYGAGGGLGYVQIFQSDLSVSPHLNTNNSDSSCYPSSSPTTQTTITGDWKEVFVYGFYRIVLEAQVPFRDLSTSNLSIVYQPNIPVQGQYDIYATTPGCIGSSNCFQRTQIQYDLELSPNEQITVVSDQNTFSDRRTLIYSGFVTPASNSFRPSITFHPAVNATMPNSGEIVSVMADTLEFVRNTSAPILVSILEYNVSASVVENSNNSSLKAWKPLNQQLPIGSTVHSIDFDRDTLYIGGEFDSNNSNNSTGLFKNIVSYRHSTGQFLSLSDIQLNGTVLQVLMHNEVLYAAGEFNTTTTNNVTLNNVAQFDTSKRVWSGLENGVDGPANGLLFDNDATTLTVSGSFKHRLSQKPHVSIENAIYNTTIKSWIERSSLLIGDISSSFASSNDSSLLFSGALRGAQTHRANLIMPASKFALLDDETMTAGVTWTQNSNLTVIIAGYAPSTNISTVYIQQPNGWKTLDSFQGQVYTLATFDNRLYVGGHYAHAQSPSLAVYDLLSSTKVEGISGVFMEGGNPGTVYVIKVHADGKRILVGGQFLRVGSLDCYGVCVLDPVVRQWNPLVEGVSGTVYDMISNAKQVVLVGDLHVHQSQEVKMASVVGGDVQVNNKMDPIPGTPVTVVNGALNEDEDMWMIAGFLSGGKGFFVGATNNNNGYTSLDTNMGVGTEIRQLLLAPVISSSNTESRYPSGTQNMLLAVGHLHLTDYGSTSAALYDGTKWYPYLLTTQLDGQPGIVHQIVHATNYNGMRPARKYLSVAAVILISIAISTGTLFAMSALGLLFMYKHHHKHSVGPEPMPEWSPRHRHLIDTYGLFGVRAAVAAAGPSHSTSRHVDNEIDLGISPTTTFVNNPLPVIATTAAAATTINPFDTLVALAKSSHIEIVSESQPKLFSAKYEFKAQEYGELSLQAGDILVVTDVTDNVWWLGYKDGGGGQPISGVFPSNYVTRL